MHRKCRPLTSQEWTDSCPGTNHTLSHILTKSDLQVEDRNSTEHQADHIWDQEWCCRGENKNKVKENEMFKQNFLLSIVQLCFGKDGKANEACWRCQITLFVEIRIKKGLIILVFRQFIVSFYSKRNFKITMTLLSLLILPVCSPDACHIWTVSGLFHHDPLVALRREFTWMAFLPHLTRV